MDKTSITTLELVRVKRKSLEDYRRIAGDGLIDEIRLLAARLKGARLLHVNATASGGGVAELLNSLVPLEQKGKKGTYGHVSLLPGLSLRSQTRVAE